MLRGKYRHCHKHNHKNGDDVGHIHGVNPCPAWLVRGRRVPSPNLSRQPLRPTQPGHPSVSKRRSTGDGFGHCWGRNGEFCVAVGSVTRTAGIVA